MASYVMRAVLPSGTSFDGQIVFDTTTFNIPTECRSQFASVTYSFVPAYVIKNTGFEPIKHRVANTSTTSVEVDVSIQLVGNAERRYVDLLREFAVAIMGAGMYIEFYDDWATDKVYTGRWINAAKFVENSEITGTGKIDFACWKYEDV